jgi:uncharacterized protein (TIGR02001 family)
MQMKKIILASAMLSSVAAFSQTAAPAPEPADTWAYNVGVVSEYRYRGISQSAVKPALQGGVDYTDKSGAYIGTWLSSISWIKDSDAKGKATGPVEWDIYGGYRGALNDTVSFDVGGLEYYYAGNTLNVVPGAVNANTFELYLALSVGAFTAKISDSTTNLFGYMNSKGSRYLDLSYTFDFGDGLTLVPHVGSQYVANNPASYEDYSLALNKDMGDGLVLSATALGTNFKTRQGAAYILPGSGGKDLGAANLVLGIKKSF